MSDVKKRLLESAARYIDASPDDEPPSPEEATAMETAERDLLAVAERLATITYANSRANQRAATETQAMADGVSNVPSWWRQSLSRFNAEAPAHELPQCPACGGPQGADSGCRACVASRA
jgi:hypothetical protein